MSLLEQASLIVTPNAYKESKLYSVVPSDGTGDMTVVRATTATRVNESGLIEVVPKNLASYSEQFDNGVWAKSGATVTVNVTTSPDGTNNADKLIDNSTLAGHSFNSATSMISGTTYTWSIFAKMSEIRYLTLRYVSGGAFSTNYITTFDLLNGTATNSATLPASSFLITSFGNGWYKCSISQAANATGTGTYAAYLSKDGVASTYTGNGTDGLFIYGAQLEQGSTATSYFPTTTRLNIPRIDYTSGEGAILVEGQRTNLALYSEQFDNAYWSKSGATVSANVTTSPDGTINADSLIESVLNENHKIFRNITSILASTPYSYSIKVKPNGRQWIFFSQFGLDNSRIWFDVQNAQVGTISNASASTTYSNAKIETLTNGWVNISFTFTTTFTVFYNHILLASANGINTTYLGDGTSGVYLWGAQLEAGSYATSYIPTVASSVTRNADVISKTGISSLIGQTEGTLFFNGRINSNSSSPRNITLSDGTGANRVILGFGNNGANRIDYDVISGGVLQTSGLGLFMDMTTDFKIIALYSTNNFKLFINGVLIATDSSGITFSGTTLNKLAFLTVTGTSQVLDGSVKSLQLYKTALTDTECIALTTL